jgi:hypothetical protein
MFPCWIIVISILMIGALYQPPSNPITAAKTELTTQGFQIISATIDSPAIDVNVNSTKALIQYAHLSNITTVYNTNQGLVVFDAKNNVGYFYNPLSNGTFFGVPVNWELFVLMMVAMVVGLVVPFFIAVIIDDRNES